MTNITVTVEFSLVLQLSDRFIRKALKDRTVYITHSNRSFLAEVVSVEHTEPNTLVYKLREVFSDNPIPDGEYRASYHGLVKVLYGDRMVLESISQLNLE